MRELSWWEWIISSITVFFMSQCSVVHQDTPKQAVNSVFKIAQQQKFQALAQLCDPQARNDGDTDCLCALSSDYTPHSCSATSHNRISKADFASCFSEAKISGPIKQKQVWGDTGEQASIAFVPFSLNPELCWGKSAETFEMIQVGKKWFLLSF